MPSDAETARLARPLHFRREKEARSNVRRDSARFPNWTLSEPFNRLFETIEDIDVAMLTTRRPDGELVSRPMATQRRAEGAHLWFVVEDGSPKVEEIRRDPNVNLAYFRERARSGSPSRGRARTSRDRFRIRELYEPSWKTWFPDLGGVRDGGPDDPRIVLIGVDVRSASSMRIDRKRPLVLLDDSAASLVGSSASGRP